jgi:hypothetical protein
MMQVDYRCTKCGHATKLEFGPIIAVERCEPCSHSNSNGTLIRSLTDDERTHLRRFFEQRMQARG